ncbi:ankyrin repeat domain-containing protein 16-like [Galendromus occidentalis]|uniref:Alpha-latrotoxin n=1 Tax=Galendromus occidentalis TaxID=34638 RepID=A0AAJ6QXP5_9ACAR|nr:ankyrin repeat domain-containing protein 16-like [Galendromus occidentalis]
MPQEPPSLESLRKKLFNAAKSGDASVIITSKGQDRSALLHPASSDTVLHVAARYGHLDVIRALLENLNLDYLLTAVNQDGKCALHEAAQNKHVPVARYLIQKGTAVDVLKRADWTPLMLACTRDRNTEMLNLLLGEGAQPCLRNKDGWTALHIAAR